MANADFIEHISGDDDDEEGEEGEERLPSCMDYVMHFLSIFWKVLFAFVPPTGIIKVLHSHPGDVVSSFHHQNRLNFDKTSILLAVYYGNNEFD